MIDKHLLRISLSALLASSAAFAQSLAFEVATVKPSPPLDMGAVKAGTAHIGTKINAGRVDIGTASLFRLICTAYRIRPSEVVGPDWLKTTMFDIQAKIPDGGTTDKIPEMLQALLMERFGLKIHRESKEQPVYALVLAQAGPKLKESSPVSLPSQGADGLKPPEMSMPTIQGDIRITRTAQGINVEMPGGEISGKLRMTPYGGPGPRRIHVESSGTTMKTLAELLSVGVVDRPVTDMTGLTGRYELAVDLSEDDAMNVARAAVSFGPGVGGEAGRMPGTEASDPSGYSLLKSLQNLGLKLEPRKLPRDMLVIDQVNKTPTAN